MSVYLYISHKHTHKPMLVSNLRVTVADGIRINIAAAGTFLAGSGLACCITIGIAIISVQTDVTKVS